MLQRPVTKHEQSLKNITTQFLTSKLLKEGEVHTKLDLSFSRNSLFLNPSKISTEELRFSNSLILVFNARIGSQSLVSLSPSPFNPSQKFNLLPFTPLSKSTIPSTPTSSDTIAFLIADKSIRIFALGLHFSRTFLLKSGDEYARRNSENFGCNFFTNSISAGGGERIAGTENAGAAELKKFSSSRSNEVARFLNELARSFINRRSASAESRTSLQPLERKEKAFEGWCCVAIASTFTAEEVRGSYFRFRFYLEHAKTRNLISKMCFGQRRHEIGERRGRKRRRR